MAFIYNPSSLTGDEASIKDLNLGSTWGTGDLLGTRVAVPPPAHKLDQRDGTAATPVKIGVSASFSRTDATTRAELNAMGPEGTDGPDGATVLRSTIKGSTASQVQVCAGSFAAWQTGEYAESGADACPVLTLARVSGSATGRAIGGYSESSIETATARGGQAMELRVKNSSGESHPYVANAGSKSMGIWLNASSAGTADSGAAVQVGQGFSRQFDVGLGFNEGSIKTASFRDDSTSQWSILIKKAHEKAAIAVATGQVVIGAETPATATPSFEVSSAAGLDPIADFGNASVAGNYSVRLHNSTGICKIVTVNSEGFALTGTKQGDAGVVFTPGKILHFGASGKTSQLRLSEAGVGFYATAPQAQPKVTGSRATGEASKILLEKLAAIGLILNESTA